MSNIKFFVYTDGSCINNGKKNSAGAIGVFFSDDDPDNYSQAIDNDGNKITNQTMELLAVIQALKIIGDKITKGQIKPNIIHIYTDSSYVINCITKWYSGWIKSNWKNSKGKDVENKELIELLYELKNKYIVIFKHIKSHQNELSHTNPNYIHWYGNKMADKLATTACREYMADKMADKIIEKELNSELENKSENELQNELDDELKIKSSKTKKIIKKKITNSLNV